MGGMTGLPYCRFASSDGCRLGVGVGDQILDLKALSQLQLLRFPGLEEPTLNVLAASGESASLRARLLELLEQKPGPLASCLIPQQGTELLVPFEIGDYTDFYASLHHATRVGSMFRPDNPLLPNYRWVPIAYHGRASTVVVSGTPVPRPWGQVTPEGDNPPRFGPSQSLDYELELGIFVGAGNPMGTAIPIGEAHRHIFGACLLNDWSARDLQRWEYQPLGPFLAKSFCTSISPWVIPWEALEPYRCQPDPREPAPLPHLAESQPWALDIRLEVWLQSAQMGEPFMVSRTNFRHMYWTLTQMLAHHASNGCALRPGDLLASGTVSGPEVEAAGCLLERTWQGPGQPRRPLELPSGEKRLFLEEGDEVILRGFCEQDGLPPLTFGECRGRVR